MARTRRAPLVDSLPELPVDATPTSSATPARRAMMATGGNLAGGVGGGLLATQVFQIGDLLDHGTGGIIAFTVVLVASMALAGWMAWLRYREG